MRTATTLTLLSLLTLTSTAALADDTQPVTGSGGGFSGSGTLTATSNGNGGYTVTGISGTGVDSLLAPGAFNGNDNLLLPSQSPSLDDHGFAFTDTLGDTGYYVDIFSSGTSYQASILDTDNLSQQIPVTFNLGSAQASSSAVQLFARNFAPAGSVETFSYDFAATSSAPEPASFVLLGSGLAGIAGLIRRRRA